MSHMSTSCATKNSEMVLKRHLVKWLEHKGFQYWCQEFEFMRRPDLVAFSFTNEHPTSAASIFSRIPFDYLVSKYSSSYFRAEMLAHRFGLQKGAVVRDLNRLVELDFLAKTDKGYRVIKSTPFLAQLTTIECKMTNWKKGLEQAITYKMLFSMESYLALPEKEIKKVDVKMFKKHGIGLLSVDPSGAVNEEVYPEDSIPSHYLHSASASIAKRFRLNRLKKVQPVT